MPEDKQELNVSEGQRGGRSGWMGTGSRAGEDAAVARSARARQRGRCGSQESWGHSE